MEKLEVPVLEVAVDVDKSFADFWDHPDIGVVVIILWHIAYHGFEGQVDG